MFYDLCNVYVITLIANICVCNYIVAVYIIIRSDLCQLLSFEL